MGWGEFAQLWHSRGDLTVAAADEELSRKRFAGRPAATAISRMR